MKNVHKKQRNTRLYYRGHREMESFYGENTVKFFDIVASEFELRMIQEILDFYFKMVIETITGDGMIIYL